MFLAISELDLILKIIDLGVGALAIFGWIVLLAFMNRVWKINSQNEVRNDSQIGSFLDLLRGQNDGFKILSTDLRTLIGAFEADNAVRNENIKKLPKQTAQQVRTTLKTDFKTLRADMQTWATEIKVSLQKLTDRVDVLPDKAEIKGEINTVSTRIDQVLTAIQVVEELVKMGQGMPPAPVSVPNKEESHVAVVGADR